MKKYSVLVLILLLVVAIPVAAQNGGVTEVSYQLSWIHEYSAAPFYLAEANGHFADAGLDVTLLEGGFQDGEFVDGMGKVLANEAQFGAADSSSILLARAAGKPVVAIATITQRSPFCLISLADSEIFTPQDLVGKTVSITDGGARMVYDALLHVMDIDPATVNTISRTSFGIDPLLNGEVDVVGGWSINEGVQVQEAGYEYNAIFMSDYAVDTYDFVIFTTEDMVANNPDTVEQFLQAVTLGLADFIADADQAAELALTYNSELDFEQQLHRAEAMIPLINVPGTKPGVMDPQVWEVTQEILLENGALAEEVDLEAAYLPGFLNLVYGESR